MAAIRTVPASVKTGVLKFLAVHAFFVVDKAALGKVMLDSTYLFVPLAGVHTELEQPAEWQHGTQGSSRLS